MALILEAVFLLTMIIHSDVSGAPIYEHCQISLVDICSQVIRREGEIMIIC